MIVCQIILYRFTNRSLYNMLYTYINIIICLYIYIYIYTHTLSLSLSLFQRASTHPTRRPGAWEIEPIYIYIYIVFINSSIYIYIYIYIYICVYRCPLVQVPAQPAPTSDRSQIGSRKHRSAPRERCPQCLSLWGPWGTPLHLEIGCSWAPVKPQMGPCKAPKGTNTKVTSAKGHFCTCKRGVEQESGSQPIPQKVSFLS